MKKRVARVYLSDDKGVFGSRPAAEECRRTVAGDDQRSLRCVPASRLASGRPVVRTAEFAQVLPRRATLLASQNQFVHSIGGVTSEFRQHMGVGVHRQSDL